MVYEYNDLTHRQFITLMQTHAVMICTMENRPTTAISLVRIVMQTHPFELAGEYHIDLTFLSEREDLMNFLDELVRKIVKTELGLE